MWLIPAKTVASFKQGMTGIGVWSLQHALNDVQTDIGLDGVFGPGTEEAVKRFQTTAKLTPVDGIAGPLTQKALAMRIVDAVAARDAAPPGLLAGFAEGEGGWLLAPVNTQVSGGIDCGLFQRRVYQADYADDPTIERAFNTTYQADQLAKGLVERRGVFIARPGTNDGYGGMSAREKAWRLAALNHNYPVGADRLSRTPVAQLPTYWTTPQSWVTQWGFRFPDGSPVRTPLEWCHLYAGVLGWGVHGTGGSVTRFTTSWP